jgi:TfoX/Sxy family transcriptional regulator of competence genes
MTREERYETVVKALLQNSEVSQSKKKGFGSNSIWAKRRIFAMLSSEGKFVVKLPEQRVDALVASGDGERWDAGKRRPMKEWFAVAPKSEMEWLSLAREAMAFAASKR